MALWLTLTTTWAQTDATSSIVNPNFDGRSFAGWQQQGMWVQNNNSFSQKNNYAYAEVQSGTWHSGYDGSTTWEFDCDTQTLTISGNGELWYEQPAEVIEINEVYGIKHVILGEGITSVSGFCNGFDKLIDVMLPDSLLSIGGNSFFPACHSLNSSRVRVVYPLS